jgi:ACS family tartrate transporter-like MFS transporter
MPQAQTPATSPLHRKIALRLIPFLMLLYMVSFLDRVNISFAALTMNRDLGITDSFYGVAAGIFFLGYCACEVPANLMLARFGARRWLASLVFTWGLVTVSTAFVHGRSDYLVMRCLLGVVEAGFFPGVIYYLTLWLTRPVRARLMAFFILAIPLSSFIGSPISAHLLLLDGVANLRGWQWLFLIEGAPAVVLGGSQPRRKRLSFANFNRARWTNSTPPTSLPLAIAPRVWVWMPWFISLSTQRCTASGSGCPRCL